MKSKHQKLHKIIVFPDSICCFFRSYYFDTKIKSAVFLLPIAFPKFFFFFRNITIIQGIPYILYCFCRISRLLSSNSFFSFALSRCQKYPPTLAPPFLLRGMPGTVSRKRLKLQVLYFPLTTCLYGAAELWPTFSCRCFSARIS